MPSSASARAPATPSSSPFSVSYTARRPFVRSAKSRDDSAACATTSSVFRRTRSERKTVASLAEAALQCARNRRSHAANCRSGRGRTRNGPSRSSSQRAAWRITPGAASGAAELVVSSPAFPHELPEQSSPRSSSSTDRPARASASAQQTPIAPPPMTTTSSETTVTPRATPTPSPTATLAPSSDRG